MAIVYLCLGSNMGDKIGNIQQATRLLCSENLLKLIRTSTIYETEPWGVKDQSWFVNAVIEAKTKLEPEELLAHCQKVEKMIGRNRELEKRWGERPIDIDILFYGNEIIEDENLVIPHKHLHERAFALVPLLELIPDFIHPVLNKSLLDLHEALENPEDVYLYGTRINE